MLTWGGGRSAIAVFVAVILLVAVIGKLANPSSLLHVLEGTWGVSHLGSEIAFLVLLVVETVIAVGLLVPGWRLLFAKAALVFFVVVTISPIVQLATGSAHGCGCGVGDGVMPPKVEQSFAILRNGLVLLLLASFFGRQS